MNRPIKVIKGDERERAKIPSAEAPVKKSRRDPARDMIKTVSEWVRETRQKRDGISKIKFEDLFAN